MNRTNNYRINRHLFDKGILQLEQGIAEQNSKEFESPPHFGCDARMSSLGLIGNERALNEAEMLKSLEGLQNEGCRLAKCAKLNSFSLSTGVYRLFFFNQ